MFYSELLPSPLISKISQDPTSFLIPEPRRPSTTVFSTLRLPSSGPLIYRTIRIFSESPLPSIVLVTSHLFPPPTISFHLGSSFFFQDFVGSRGIYGWENKNQESRWRQHQLWISYVRDLERKFNRNTSTSTDQVTRLT